MGASRFPGKPMAEIAGIPMVGHCYFRSRLAVGIDDVYVATCDQEIADYINLIGGKAIMTADTHTRASTRTAEALEIVENESGETVDIVVMVQGDEPLIAPEAIAESLNHFSEADIEIVNIMSRFRREEDFTDKNNVKVVVNCQNDALYFSREPIPSPWKGWGEFPAYMQTGIIAFRREALHHFNQLEETMLEQVESVDMNRVLETGNNIRMVLTDTFTLGVDTLEELALAEEILVGDEIIEQYETVS